MTWPRALTYVGIWLLLTAYWASQLRSVPEPGAQSSPAATPVGDLSAADVVEIEMQSDGQSLHAILVDGRWEVLQPAGARVAADLIAAIVDVVLDVEEIRTIRPQDPGGDEFGLADSTAHVTFHSADGTSLRLLLGKFNPARTAIYGRREGAREVLLLGLNVRYYVRMALQAATSDTSGE